MKTIRVMASISVLMAMVSCQNDVYDPEKGEKREEPNTFDFSTTSKVQLNVNYQVPSGYQVLFELYLEDPVQLTDGGQIQKREGVSPALRRMTDKEGHYSGEEVISACHGETVWIYSDNFGVPRVMTGELKNGVISVSDEEVSGTASTRASYYDEKSAQKNGYLTLGGWNKNGVPTYLDTNYKLNVTSGLLKVINNTIPEGGTASTAYRQEVDFSIDDPQNRDANVWIRMVNSGSGAASSFGYYCYREGDTPEQIKNAKRCIIFPNTLTANYYSKTKALNQGDCVQLHYIDEEGVDQGTVFPNGVKIGWFLLNDKFYGGNGTAFYSTSSLNADGRTHTVAFKYEDLILLSFEDWNDNDYNDVVFNVYSNPIEAIQTPDIPEVILPDEGESENENAVAYRINYKGILAFEDNWPSKGDYDLNDVIVKYNSYLLFNSKNEVVSTDENYTLTWSGASYQNAFGYQMNVGRSNIATTIQSAHQFEGQGVDPDLAKATVNLFKNAKTLTNNNTTTASFKVNTQLTTPVSHESFGVPPFNPFIVVHSEMGMGRTEVHLVDYLPTDKADKSLFGTKADLSGQGRYYVASGNYPFAIHLCDAEDFNSREQVPIDQSFPRFATWVSSYGADAKDWYK